MSLGQQDLKVMVVIQVLRVLVVLKVLLVLLANLAKGADQVLMVPEECQGNQEQRVTEDLMDFLVCQVKKVIEENSVHQAPLADLVMMEKEEKMERLGQGVFLARAAQEDCSDQEGLPVPLDSLVLLELMALRVQKETWVLKESLGLPDSRESLAHKVFQVLKALLVHLVKKDPRVNLVSQACLVQTGLMVTRAKKVHLEKKVPKDSPAHKGQLDILVPEV